jgi:hypothetical protein
VTDEAAALLMIRTASRDSTDGVFKLGGLVLALVYHLKEDVADEQVLALPLVQHLKEDGVAEHVLGHGWWAMRGHSLRVVLDRWLWLWLAVTN